MTAPLAASAKTIGNLLASSTFQIPAYQREYAWRNTEVDEFWQDITGALDGESYFLGLIILAGDQGRKQVVDGQQRLLTVSLLSAAIYQESLSARRQALADNIQSTLMFSMDYDTDRRLRRIQLTDSEADATYHSLLTEEFPSESINGDYNSSANRLRSAYWRLRRALRAGDTSDSQQLFRRLGAYVKFLNEQLFIAVFEHPDESSAYNVFEVVNTRGRQLTTADLLKNYILRETPEVQRPQIYSEWMSMIEAFSAIEAQSDFVQFIRHAIMLDAGYVLPKALYDFIAARGHYTDQQPADPDTLMFGLKTHLPAYIQMLDPTAEGPATTAQLDVFASLSDLGISAVRPLLLAMIHTPDADTGFKEVLRIVVRRLIVGNLGTGGIERKFAEAAQIVWRTRAWQPGLEVLRELDRPRDEFISVLSTRSYNRGVLTFLRRSIAAESLTPAELGTLVLLRPRGASDHWPDFADNDVTFWGSTLGNCALITAERRPRGANSWDGVKRTLLPLVVDGDPAQGLAGYAIWSPETVAQFGLECAEDAADVWY